MYVLGYRFFFILLFLLILVSGTRGFRESSSWFFLFVILESWF